MGAAILQDLVMVMVVAAATTILFYRLRQPLVLGYLLAGVIIGPFTPFVRAVSDVASIEALAELGIIFLMFALGLEFNLRRLRDVGATAVIAGTLEIGVMLFLGYRLGLALGWGPMNAIFLGAIVSISSTTVIVKLLMERGDMQKPFADVVFGILIVEDVLAVVLVALLTGFGDGVPDVRALGGVVGSVALFAFIAVAVGLVLVPRLIDWVSRFHVEEVLIITVVGLALGGGLLALKLGFSLALGAFLMGAVIAESRAVRRVEHKVVPIRDLFTAVFFVAVGMLIDPAAVWAYKVPILLVSLLVVAGKLTAATAATFLAGRDIGTSFRVGSTLAQIGEFSFIIAALGLTLGVTDAFLYTVAVAVSAVTTLTSPFVARAAPVVAGFVQTRAPGGLARAAARWPATFARWQTRGMGADNPGARHHGARVLIYAAWLLALFIAGAFLSLWFGDRVGDHWSVGDDLKRAGGVLVIGALGLPFFVAFTRATEAWAHEIAKARAFAPSRLARADPSYRGPRFAARAVASLSAVGLLFIAGRVAWGVHPWSLPRLWLLVPSLLVLAACAVTVWRRSTRLYVWMEGTLDDLLGAEEEPLQKLRERYPWGVDVEEVPVLASSWASYSSLRDLDIRERTGCTVLNVERGSAVIANPHPDMALLPGDRVVLVGTRAQIDNAAVLMLARGTPSGGREAKQAPAGARGATSVRVPASSPAIGATLGALGVPERSGARVASVNRANGEPVPPGARTVPKADDRVLLAGTPGAVARAKQVLGVRDDVSIPSGTRRGVF